MTALQPLVLASGSPYRRELLARLRLPFEWAAPDVDESPMPDELAPARAGRLAIAKARALAARFPQHLIIGSDQVAELDGRHLGKPGSRENAIAQLSACSGEMVLFHTGLCLFNSASGETMATVETFSVQFRSLDLAEIERYIDAEQPLDCAGSFKSEGLGISLFASFHGRDPNALVGLPLMALCDMLRQCGWQLP